MARTFARLKASVWADDDWRTLPPGAQWAYMLLLSQPHINNCGVLPYLPTRWARLAAGVTEHDVEQFLQALEHARFVIVDQAAGEVLIRSFVKHDGVEKVPNVKASAERQYLEIESRHIRHALAAEYPHLFAYDNSREPTVQAKNQPLAEPLSLRVSEPLAERVNARASCADHPTPTPTPAAATRQPTGHTPPAAATERLRTAGWNDSQIRGADLELATAWLDHAEADPTCHKPGALAWTKYQTGTPPDNTTRSTLAPGATGTRSTSPTLPDRPATPEPERIAPPPEFVALANGHPAAPEPVVSSRARKTQPEPIAVPSDAHAEKAPAPDPEGAPS